jgi:hypothetical protein
MLVPIAKLLILIARSSYSKDANCYGKHVTNNGLAGCTLANLLFGMR